MKQGEHIAVLNDNPAILQPKQKNNNILLDEKNSNIGKLLCLQKN